MIPTFFLRELFLSVFAVVALASVAASQVRGGETGAAVEIPVVTSPYLVLIRDPVVQQSLKLKEDQRQAVRRLTDRIDQPLWMIRAMPLQENAEALKKLIAVTRPQMRKILSRPQQRRLDQIVLHAVGVKSLLLDKVREELKLTDDQLRQIVQAFEEMQKGHAELQRETNNEQSSGDVQARSEQLEAETRRTLAEILDEQQHRNWATLLGEAFDTSRLGNTKFKAPQLDGTDGWINSQPIAMQDLRGKVIVLHYWTYG